MIAVAQGRKRSLPGSDRQPMMDPNDNENLVERVCARPSEEPCAGAEAQPRQTARRTARRVSAANQNRTQGSARGGTG